MTIAPLQPPATTRDGADPPLELQARPPTLATQKIRLATTMTGGVSLAIWMGGVTRELNLLAQASTWRQHLPGPTVLPQLADAAEPDHAIRELYLRLLDLMDVSISTDVLSGTSAGGINAALLATSRIRGVDLAALRELWIDVGSMETLLRQPTDRTFPSLMYGDDVMLKTLEDQLGTLGWPSAPGLLGFDKARWVPPSTTLFITTTLLDGETSRFSDSYGTLVQDTDHRGLFTFTEHELARDGSDALALAARSSSSFPVAFEPSFLPYTSAIPGSKNVHPHPAMAAFANITRPHWVADGGLLANRPLQPLLQAMFNRPTDRQTRRVLLYIVPSSGDVPAPLSALPPDYFNTPLPLGTALLKDLTAMLNQSISSELRAIREHNDTLDTTTESLLRLAELGTGRAAGLLTLNLLSDYRHRVGTALIRPVISALSRLVSTLPTPDKPSATGQPTMPTPWADDLLTPAAALAQCEDEALAAVTASWDVIPTDYPALASFGRPAFDGAKTVVLTILRKAFMLAARESDRVWLAQAVCAVNAAFVPPRHPDLDLLIKDVVAEDPNRHVQDVAIVGAQRYARQLVIGPAQTQDDAREPVPLGQAWERLAGVLVDNGALLRTLATQQEDVPAEAPTRAAPRSRARARLVDAEAVNTYLDYLLDADTAPRKQQVQLLATRLFALYATDRALSPITGDVQQPLELIQLSADTRCLLDPARQTARSKLTGVQIHHFGAFFKSSWRANDWMWGRIDGAGWLVHVLLDPKRVLTHATTQAPQGSAADWFFTQLRDRVVGAPPARVELPTPRANKPDVLDEALIRAELSFLDDPALPLPKSLPLTALWVATAWQRWIAANELPELARQVNECARENSVPWAREVLHLDAAKPTTAVPLTQIAGMLASNPVSGEALTSQVGTPLMARTATKVLATSTAALATETRVPAAARPVAVLLRTITLATYRITSLTDGTPRRLLLAGLVAMVVGVAVGIQQSTIVGFGGTAVALAGALTLVLGIWGLGRQALRALLGVVIVGALLLTALPWSRHWLFATDVARQGFVGRNAGAWVNWLGDAWWHPLMVIGIVVALLSMAVIAGARSTTSHATVITTHKAPAAKG